MLVLLKYSKSCWVFLFNLLLCVIGGVIYCIVQVNKFTCCGLGCFTGFSFMNPVLIVFIFLQTTVQSSCTRHDRSHHLRQIQGVLRC